MASAFDQKSALEIPFKKTDAIGGFAPATVASHSGLRRITFIQKLYVFKVIPTHHKRPPQTERWWRKRGASYKQRGFPMKIAMKQM
jgi:hypothetical protein